MRESFCFSSRAPPWERPPLRGGAILPESASRSVQEPARHPQTRALSELLSGTTSDDSAGLATSQEPALFTLAGKMMVRSSWKRARTIRGWGPIFSWRRTGPRMSLTYGTIF